jgi:hypothetical protein
MEKEYRRTSKWLVCEVLQGLLYSYHLVFLLFLLVLYFPEPFIRSVQGLGTSTNVEGKEYFKNITKHRKVFYWEDQQDDNNIELAFSKKRISDRKDWLSNYQVGLWNFSEPDMALVFWNETNAHKQF